MHYDNYGATIIIVRPVWAIANRWKSGYNPERREYIDKIARVPEESATEYLVLYGLNPGNKGDR